MQGTPWSPRDLLRTILLASMAAGGVAACYLEASSTINLSTQLICLAIAIIFVAIAGAGSAALLADGLREIRVRRSEVTQQLTDAIAQRRVPAPAAPPGLDDRNLVSGVGMSKYHRPGCLLVAGKFVDTLDRSDHLHAGREPCDICHPDERMDG
jgi:hypothetical protein